MEQATVPAANGSGKILGWMYSVVNVSKTRLRLASVVVVDDVVRYGIYDDGYALLHAGEGVRR